MLRWIFIVLHVAHRNNSPWIDISPHSDTLFWFRANPSLLLLLNTKCLAKKQDTNFIVFGLTPLGHEPSIYHTQAEHKHANHYTTIDNPLFQNMDIIFTSNNKISTQDFFLIRYESILKMCNSHIHNVNKFSHKFFRAFFISTLLLHHLLFSTGLWYLMPLSTIFH